MRKTAAIGHGEIRGAIRLNWNPARFERWHDCVDKSSTGVAHIQTDAGPAFLKALGNAEGPHALVREWVGTAVARWFGLTTFDFAQIVLEPHIEVKLGRNKKAEPGPAFVTREEKGMPWSGKADDLKLLVNAKELTGLVIVDTWVLNADRCPPHGSDRRPNYDNVFLSEEGLTGNKKRLIAMDFSDCLKPTIELTPRIADIGNVKDERVFGLFQQFEEFLQPAPFERGLERLRQVNERALQPVVQQLPVEWEVSDGLRSALVQFLVQRAAYLVEHLRDTLGHYAHIRIDP